MLVAARSALDTRWDEIAVVELAEPVASLASEVAEVYALRAQDAVHLASALVLGDVAMVTLDARLARAALDAGLAVGP